MYPLLKQVYGTSVSYFTHLIQNCLSVKSLNLSKTVHSRLIKVGLIQNTYLCNRCLDLYFRFGTLNDASKLFDEINVKNTISWNICLKGLLNFGEFEKASLLFDEMPERDVVSWNSLISGCVSNGFLEYGLKCFSDMQIMCVKPSEFTFSILTSLVLCVDHGKQVHGSMIRRGVSYSNVVVWNSMIDMYGKLGLVDYAIGVFLTMEKLDMISWNSLISSFCKMGNGELALSQFGLMRSMGYSIDEYTMSIVITACSDLQDLNNGNQLFTICVKSGFLTNTIVSSSVIDMFSKCERFRDSVNLFEDLHQWDSAVCNSMISSYSRHGFADEALKLFLCMMRKDLQPNEFTISSVLSLISIITMENGTQVHCLTVKLGFEMDTIVSSSLVEMYSTLGLIDVAKTIFANMETKDLISWNTMINGLTHNGRLLEALNVFEKLLKEGPLPDRITFIGVLQACSYGGFVKEGISIFLLMEKYENRVTNVTIDDQHYACVVDLLCQAGELNEAVWVIDKMPYEPSFLIWGFVLRASVVYGDLKLTEKVAERMLEMEPCSVQPYLVLARAYEMRGRWEGVARIRKEMRRKVARKITEYCSIGIKSHVYTFQADHLRYLRSQDIYSMLGLLACEMENEGQLDLNHDRVDTGFE